MASGESLKARYNAPGPLPVPFLFIQDRSRQVLAGLLICVPWPRGVSLSDQQRQMVAGIHGRLVAQHEHYASAAYWILVDRIVPLAPAPEAAWLRRKLADHPAVMLRPTQPHSVD